MYQALTQKEWEHEEWKNELSLFMLSLHQTLGPHTVLRDLVELGVEETPQYDPYEDESQKGKRFQCLKKNRR